MSASWRSLTLSSYLAGKLHRRLDVHLDDVRNARLGHGHADELAGELHRDLVVGDEDELRLARHLAHEVAEALGVGIVERGIHLVEEAEGRRVELEEREDERDRGERLLAAREELDRLILLAWRLREDLQASVEHLLAGEPQACLPAAEERREHLLEVRVDRVEGFLQELARLAVDALDRGLQRLHRLREVGGLRVEEE